MLPRSRLLLEQIMADSRKWPAWLGYTVTLAAVAVAFALTLAIPPVQVGTPFAFFYLAIAVSAYLGRLRSGLLAIVLSSLIVAVWFMPHTLGQLIPLTKFVVVAWIIAWLVHTLDAARATIYEDREWLRITLGSIADAVIATDAQGKVTWMNGVATELTGWRNEDAVGRLLTDIFNIVNEETRHPVANPVMRVLAERRVVGLANHTVLIAQDGVERAIEDSAAPILDREGNIRGVVLVFHDSSERRTRERALQAAETRLRLALDAGRMVAWEWDPSRDTIWTTDNYPAIYGQPAISRASDGLGVVHPEDREKHRLAVASVHQEDSFHTEFRIIRPDDGRVVWLEEWGMAVAGTTGEVTQVVGVTMDITQRQQIEAELKQSNETLELRVAERTAELQQINHELNQFAYVASHDLKSPLRGIATLSGWIQDETADVLPPKSKEYLEKIQQRTQRMETLLNDLLAYSRAGRARYPVEQVDLPAMIRDTAALLNVPPGFTVTVEEPTPRLIAERVPLETVLRNLVGNAAKHHDHPMTGKVVVTACDLGDQVEFTVADDGPGIASDFHERIFRVFQTLRPRDEVEGSGMGLAIVKRLVEGRGGVVEVKSAPGAGATFRFTWPKRA
jgi:PAS domain S-box-containing protein